MADLSQTARNPSQDFIRATPRNPVLGFLSDIVGASYSPQRTQQMQGMANFIGAPAISQTLDRLSYDPSGRSLFTGAGGLGGTTRMRPEALEAGLAITDFLPTSAAAKGAALAAPALAGIFIGPKARTWDALAAQKAKMLEDIGRDAKSIWQETGTWRGPDGKLRQEISDQPAKITEDVFNQIVANKQFKGPIGQAMTHQDLFKAYPESAGIPSTFFAQETPTGNVLRGRADTFQIPQLTVGGPSTTSQRSTALHELQHAVQQKEGFARGGNMSEFTNYTGALERARLNNGFDPVTGDFDFVIEEQIKRFGADPFDAYRRLAGEAEARAVQKRRNLTPEQRRATFPEESYDVPLNQLIMP